MQFAVAYMWPYISIGLFSRSSHHRSIPNTNNLRINYWNDVIAYESINIQKNNLIASYLNPTLVLIPSA